MKKSYTRKQRIIAEKISGGALANWRDWQWQVRHSVRDVDTVEKVLGIRFPAFEKTDRKGIALYQKNSGNPGRAFWLWRCGENLTF